MTLKRFAILAALCTAALSAQNYRGTLTLPVEAQWGVVHLQPGQYTITTDILGNMPVLYVSGNGIAASILTGPMTRTEVSDQGKLELTQVNGAYAVTKLVAATAGKEFTFPIPNAMKRGFNAVALQKTALPVH